MAKPTIHEAICSHVAQILKKEREQRELSMNVVAERAGLSQQMVSYVERGMRNPTLETLLRMAHAIGVDITDVIQRASQAAAKDKGRR